MICLLSSNQIISTRFSPFWFIVQEDTGTIFMVVWSQLRIKSSGISSILTTTSISNKNCSLISSKLCTINFLVEHPFRFTKPILYKSDFAQLVVKCIAGPSSSSIKLGLYLRTIALPAAIAMPLVMTPPASRTARIYACV